MVINEDKLFPAVPSQIVAILEAPRTDALLREFQPANTGRELDLARLARTLERELATANERLDEATDAWRQAMDERKQFLDRASQAESALTAARLEAEGAKADAERYRWLRANMRWTGEEDNEMWFGSELGIDEEIAADFDSRADAALKAARKESGHG